MDHFGADGGASRREGLSQFRFATSDSRDNFRSGSIAAHENPERIWLQAVHRRCAFARWPRTRQWDFEGWALSNRTAELFHDAIHEFIRDRAMGRELAAGHREQFRRAFED